jgi:hypothetical protein
MAGLTTPFNLQQQLATDCYQALHAKAQQLQKPAAGCMHEAGRVGISSAMTQLCSLHVIERSTQLLHAT